ncbi:hypothetical protein [Dyadobacter beijingensis]|uniref:hypothetical protein n=1 Tax=Dyadobacter beijingensis TaxID=365489 RepID=UPI0012F8BFFE|nr:hypothetical protein [Dyadobacter beijingensis]
MNWGAVPVIENNLTLLCDTTVQRNTPKSGNHADDPGRQPETDRSRGLFLSAADRHLLRREGG